MRKFSSYGQINRKLHYYAPRTELIDKAYRGLLGEIPDEGGHYLPSGHRIRPGNPL